MNNRKEIIKAILTAIGYVAIVSLLISCRSTHTLTHREQKKLEYFTNSRTANDTIAALRHQVDSMQHKSMQMDSLISVLKERETERQITKTKEYWMLRDSMAVSTDSLGNWTYRYWSWSDKREEVHDTIWRDRVVESDTRRVSILQDSINIYKERIDSMLRASAMRDSTYKAVADSIGRMERITEEKRKGIVERAGDGILTIAMLLILIFAISSCVKWALKK